MGRWELKDMKMARWGNGEIGQVGKMGKLGNWEIGQMGKWVKWEDRADGK